jgi:bacillithiol biosynthesis cysteine-adding enzyme BshC
MEFNKALLGWDVVLGSANKHLWLPNKAITDYVCGAEAIHPFYKYVPSIDVFKKAITDKNTEKYDRKLLVEVITGQYVGIEDQPANIAALGINTTYTVTTGHQLCLFSGPLLFIYKILSTIKLAEALQKKYPDNCFVPIFWMASEDHDFKEVNNTYVYHEKLEWADHQKGKVGAYTTRSLASVIEQMEELISNKKWAKPVLKLLKEAYLGQGSLSAATRQLIHHLFGKYGLVVVDGDDRRLKEKFRDIIEDDLLHHIPHRLIGNTSAKLAENYKPQAHYREINTFYMTPHLRERIEKEGEGRFKFSGTTPSVTKSELLSLLQNHPERFSPNVVLRPLYQEKILPNLAYVGGPGELAYWFQLRSLFEHYGINFPVLVLRNSIMLLEKSMVKRIKKLGLTVKDLLKPHDPLVKEFLNRASAEATSVEGEQNQLNELFRGLLSRLKKRDPGLAAMAEAEHKRAVKGLKKVQEKMIKAEKINKESSIRQLKKLNEMLYPGGMPQERRENGIPYLAEHGWDFIAAIKSHVATLPEGILVLWENEEG